MSMSMLIERIEELRREAERAYEHALGIASRTELLHLLRCARAVAEIETEARAALHSITAELVRNCESLGFVKGPDLLTAVEDALARAKDGGA